MWFVIVDAQKPYNDGIHRLTYKEKHSHENYNTFH